MSRKNKTPSQISFIRKLAIQYTPECLATLAEIMQDADAKSTARIAAANSLLAYGHGKPKSTDEVEREAPTETLISQELHNILVEAVHGVIDQAAIMRAQGNERASKIIEGEFGEVKELLPKSTALTHEADGDGEE